MLEQDGNLFFALAQRRNLHGEGVEAVVEILAQALVGESFGNVDVGRGQDADIDLDDGTAAQARELLILQHVQEFGLQKRRHFADFVEQNRSAIAQLELAGFGMGCAGERTLLVAEQLALKQVGRNRGAIHLEEYAMGARRKLVDQASEDFFAGAALAEQQHGDVYIGDQRGLRADLAHLGASGDEEDVFGEFLDFSAVSLFALTEAEIDDCIQFCFLKRLGEVVEGAQLHRVYDLARVVDAGQHHDLDAGLDLAQLFESLQTVDAGHEHVEQHQVGLQALFYLLQGFFAGGCGFDFVVVHLQQRFDVAEHAGFVVDQQNLGGWLHRFFPLLAAATAGLNGIRKENLQPAPGSLSTQILPPMPCTKRRAMARPNPVPSWASVLGRRKKSSKTS